MTRELPRRVADAGLRRQAAKNGGPRQSRQGSRQRQEVVTIPTVQNTRRKTKYKDQVNAGVMADPDVGLE
jgi:hypothetical protein